MPQAPDRPCWPAEALTAAVGPLLADFAVEVVDQIDSTNSELMRRFRAGRRQATLLVAEHQSAGRGRMGRPWYSSPGASLTFSLGLPLAPKDWSGLSLAVGVSLAEPLADLGARGIGLKWPNDLWLGGAKLGGILIETAALGSDRYAVIGVGLNVRQPRGALAQEAGDAAMAVPPAWLHPVTGASAPQMLAALVPGLVRDVLRFEREGWQPFAQRFDGLDLLKGRSVLLSDGRQGTACGLSADAALRLQTADGLIEVRSGELSVRPQPS